MGSAHSQAVDEAVWFSQLRHWMLVIRGHIFELALTPQGTFTFKLAQERGWTPVFEQKARARNRGRTLGKRGHDIDNSLQVYIGKSHLPSREIEQVFSTIRARYPQTLSWAQSQDFLRRFALQLIAAPDRDREYWPWFLTCTALERRTVALQPPPPKALVQLQQARERGQKNERDRASGMVDRMSGMQAGMMRSQQQNVAINMQIQNNQNFGMGYGN